ncbi:AAA family ATPase [Prevotella sp. Sow4_E9_plate]|uniref:AAA family ATPase n=1 Tax=Prevotella sp. Sow4_E9_plate TaxID=3438802 RepID=UPI003F9995BA
MRLRIENINKIKEADIALNGLTVIVGENDMGKSTIGRAFFSTIKAVSNMRSLSKESSANKASKHIDSLYKHFYGKNIIEGAMDLLPRVKSEMERICLDEAERNAFLTHLNARIDEIDLSPRQKSLLKEDIVNIRICYDQVDNPAAVLKTELAYLVDSEFLGQFCSSKSDFTCVMFDTEEEGSLVFKAKNNQVTDVSFSERGFYEDITYVESPLYFHLLDSLRNSVAYREMKSVPGYRPMVPAHVKDFVDKVWNIQSFHAQPSLFEPQSKEYHTEDIIHGSFAYDKSSRSIVYQKDGMKIMPINVASGIKSFGALQLLLDGYCISNNRPLIWDEPENHLHPQWQVELAKVIVQIVNSGIPVMISTHSPYFLQAVRYYSAMYSIEKYVNYYMAELGKDDMVSMKEVTDDLNQVFLTLAEPLNQIMNVDEVRGKLK